jgi:cysteine synthase
MRVEDVRQLVGNTPHLKVECDEATGVAIHLKLEGSNPTGSIKDRAGMRLVEDALAQGRLRAGVTLLDASSGNMGCAVAFFGRLAGFPAHIISSSKLTEDKGGFMRYYGARVEQVGDFTIEGNRICRELAEREPERYCFLDQLHSPANPAANHDTTGPEILRDFPDLACLVGSLGSGGSLLGTAEFLKAQRPGVRVVAVQAASGTRLPGTGSFDDGDYISPFIERGFAGGMFDHTVKIDAASAACRTRQLRDRGVFAGLQTGGVFEATIRAVRELGIAGDVVLLSGDSGFKNMEKLRTL